MYAYVCLVFAHVCVSPWNDNPGVSKGVQQVWEQGERLNLASSLHVSLEHHGVVRGPRIRDSEVWTLFQIHWRTLGEIIENSLSLNYLTCENG